MDICYSQLCVLKYRLSVLYSQSDRNKGTILKVSQCTYPEDRRVAVSTETSDQASRVLI